MRRRFSSDRADYFDIFFLILLGYFAANFFHKGIWAGVTSRWRNPRDLLRRAAVKRWLDHARSRIPRIFRHFPAYLVLVSIVNIDWIGFYSCRCNAQTLQLRTLDYQRAVMRLFFDYVLRCAIYILLPALAKHVSRIHTRYYFIEFFSVARINRALYTPGFLPARKRLHDINYKRA